MWRRVSIRFESDADYARAYERDLRRGRLLVPSQDVPVTMNEHVLVELICPQGEIGLLAQVVAPEIPRPDGRAMGLSFQLSPDLLLQLRGLCVAEDAALRVAYTSPTSAKDRDSEPADTDPQGASEPESVSGEFIMREHSSPERNGAPHRPWTPARGSRPVSQGREGRRTHPGPEVIQRFASRQKHAPQHAGSPWYAPRSPVLSTWPPGLPTVVEFRQAHHHDLDPIERAEFLDRIQRFIRRSRELKPEELLGFSSEPSRADLQQVYSRYCMALGIRDRELSRDTDVIRLSELVFECLHRAHEELMRRIAASGTGFTPPAGVPVVHPARAAHDARPAGADSEPSIDEDEQADPCRCCD